MKFLASFAILILFLSPCLFSYAAITKNNSDMKVSIKPTRFFEEKATGTIDLCPLCVQVMDQTIGQLLNIILNVGVIGSCSTLCNYLSKYGKTVVVGCNLVCDVVGIKAFIALIKKADLNPIWLCQEVRLCPIHDCTDPTCAQFDRIVITPETGRKGTTFAIDSFFTVFNQTGTGEIIIVVAPPGAMPLSGGELVAKGFQPGQYQMSVTLETKDDYTRDPPLVFPPGIYKFAIELCEGMCGSRHAHTRTLAIGRANFTVTAH